MVLLEAVVVLVVVVWGGVVDGEAADPAGRVGGFAFGAEVAALLVLAAGVGAGHQECCGSGSQQMAAARALVQLASQWGHWGISEGSIGSLLRGGQGAILRVRSLCVPCARLTLFLSNYSKS